MFIATVMIGNDRLGTIFPVGNLKCPFFNLKPLFIGHFCYFWLWLVTIQIWFSQLKFLYKNSKTHVTKHVRAHTHTHFQLASTATECL